MRIYTRRTVAERFWPKVDRRSLDDCWEWIGGRSKNGYGVFGLDRGGPRWASSPAHRIAWELTHGPIRAGGFVCHHCDNPACCNPQHLFVGSPADNTRDGIAKGRINPRRPFVPARGERQGLAKLTEIAIRQIRRRYAAGGITQQALATRHGVSLSALHDVITGRTWKHVE
jgi:hypothetical protein